MSYPSVTTRYIRLWMSPKGKRKGNPRASDGQAKGKNLRI